MGTDVVEADQGFPCQLDWLDGSSVVSESWIVDIEGSQDITSLSESLGDGLEAIESHERCASDIGGDIEEKAPSTVWLREGIRAYSGKVDLSRVAACGIIGDIR